MAAISLQGVTKRFGKLAAVNNLTFEVAEGEVFGFLGLNGAGKTTTIRILLDLLRPTSGQASIFGHDCQRAGLHARSHVGFLPAEMGIYSDLTGIEVLDLLARLGGKPIDKSLRSQLQERLQLPDRDLRRRLREYSSGMKRKLGIIQAFQSNPTLLILDEPTEGLDPIMQEAFYALLADVKRLGRTVFMSSHVLSEVGRVCDRIALLRDGELVLLSSVDACRRLSARMVRVFFTEDVAIAPHLPPGVEVVAAESRLWNLRVDGPLGPLLAAIATLPVADLEVAEPKLEDAVLAYYRNEQPSLASTGGASK